MRNSRGVVLLLSVLMGGVAGVAIGALRELRDRTYRSEDGFKRSDGFNHGDLLSVAKLAERAEAYISERPAA